MSKLTSVQILSATAVATSGNVTTDTVDLSIFDDVQGSLAVQVKRGGGTGSLSAVVQASLNGADFVTPSVASAPITSSTATGDILPIKINTSVKQMNLKFSVATSNISDLEAWLVVL